VVLSERRYLLFGKVRRCGSMLEVEREILYSPPELKQARVKSTSSD
jgi:hypothetical protein